MWQHPQLWYTSVTARLWGYTSYCGRSFLSGFPTQIPQTRWTLVSVRFLFLSFDFLLFSFSLTFCRSAVCVCPWICYHNFFSYFLVLPCLAWPWSTQHLYTRSVLCWNCKFFTLLLKQAHWTERVWNSVLSHFSIWHSTFPPFLCALDVQFSSISGLQLVP